MAKTQHRIIAAGLRRPQRSLRLIAGQMAAQPRTKAKGKSVDPSSSLQIIVRELPQDEIFPAATFIQYNRALVPAGEVHIVQWRVSASDPWLNAFSLYDPVVFTFHPLELLTYGLPVSGLMWRTVKV